MSPRPDVSEERKEQILNAATTVFTQKGFNKTRMDDIVEESGLSKGTLYWYFKSKNDIIIGIFDQIFNRELNQLQKLQFEDQLATERLMAFTDHIVKDVKFMLKLMPIAYEFMSLAFRNRFVQKAFKQYFNRYMDVLVPIIQQGIDTGEFQQVNAQDTAIAAGAIFEGTILLWVYDKDLVDPEKHIRSGINLIMEAIKV